MIFFKWKLYLAILYTGNTNALFCPRESVTLVVNETFDDYIWSNGMSIPFITVNTDGIYIVTVIDTNDCTTRNIMLQKQTTVYSQAMPIMMVLLIIKMYFF
jgi:hypothetical protein